MEAILFLVAFSFWQRTTTWNHFIWQENSSDIGKTTWKLRGKKRKIYPWSANGYIFIVKGGFSPLSITTQCFTAISDSVHRRRRKKMPRRISVIMTKIWQIILDLGVYLSLVFITSLAKGGYVCGTVDLSVCLLVSNITQKVMNRLQWNFMERSRVVQGRTD